MQKLFWNIKFTHLKLSTQNFGSILLKWNKCSFKINLNNLIQTDRTQINRPGSRGSLTRGRPPQQNMITHLCPLLQRAILSYFQNGKVQCPLAFFPFNQPLLIIRGQFDDMSSLKCTIWKKCTKFNAFCNIGPKYILYHPTQLKFYVRMDKNDQWPLYIIRGSISIWFSNIWK